MKLKIQDIIREGVGKNSLSASPESTLRELDNALIPYHEKELATAEKNIEKASSENDEEAYISALDKQITELGILVKLYEKKTELIRKRLVNARDSKIKSTNY